MNEAICLLMTIAFLTVGAIICAINDYFSNLKRRRRENEFKCEQIRSGRRF